MSLAAVVRPPLFWLWLRAPCPLARVDASLVEDDASGEEGDGEDVEHEDAHRAEQAEGAQDGQALRRKEKEMFQTGCWQNLPSPTPPVLGVALDVL